MIVEKCFPALGRRPSTPGHILGYARLTDIDADLEEFSMDPRRSPQRIGNAHLADKLASLMGQKDCVILPQLSARLGLRQGQAFRT